VPEQELPEKSLYVTVSPVAEATFAPNKEAESLTDFPAFIGIAVSMLVVIVVGCLVTA
jgi:hypothetical protein